MNHTEAEYINAGFHYESGAWRGDTIMKMVESERVEDRAEARRLIERGRQEAREKQK
jgi:hypothetical protein